MNSTLALTINGKYSNLIVFLSKYCRVLATGGITENTMIRNHDCGGLVDSGLCTEYSVIGPGWANGTCCSMLEPITKNLGSRMIQFKQVAYIVETRVGLHEAKEVVV